MRSWKIRLAGVVVAFAALPILSSCSAAPSIDGVWSASDGSAEKVIQSGGSCSGMYYSGSQVLDIGGPETCTLGSQRSDGTYPLVVQQPPNQATYFVHFDGNTMSFTSGGRKIVLTKQ